MEQIKLQSGIVENDVLSGKVIREVGFLKSMTDYHDNQLIITFTDDTYIHIGIDKDYFECSDHYLENNVIHPLHAFHNTGDCYVKDDKVVYSPYRSMQIEMGVHPRIDEQALVKAVNDKREKEFQEEYQAYLRLKAKFENYEETKNKMS